MIAWFTALLLMIFIITILVLMVSSRISVTINQAKLKLLNQSRREVSKEDFIDYFITKGYSEEAVSFLYQEIQKNLTRKQFSLHPEDNLHSHYFLHRDYLREVAIRTFRVNNMRSPNIPEEKLLDAKDASDTFEKILAFSHKISF